MVIIVTEVSSRFDRSRVLSLLSFLLFFFLGPSSNIPKFSVIYRSSFMRIAPSSSSLQSTFNRHSISSSENSSIFKAYIASTMPWGDTSSKISSSISASYILDSSNSRKLAFYFFISSASLIKIFSATLIISSSS